jgi:hypothetical protein
VTRGRRDRLAAALRQFGLVDRFDLVSLVSADSLPTARQLARKIDTFPEALPDGVSPTFLSEFIAEELARAENFPSSSPSVSLSGSDMTKLRAIPPGKAAAGKYHAQIFRVLNGLFAGRLVDPIKEARQFSGRKRIDIRYRNADQTGFFAELTRHEVKAPYVIIECKNYTADPDNPEFDQLSGRLNPRVGMFGIMIVRTIRDRKRTDAHRLDRRAKQEWIVVLDDNDVIAMVQSHLSGDTPTVDARLREKFEPLLFD